MSFALAAPVVVGTHAVILMRKGEALEPILEPLKIKNSTRL